MHKFHDPCPAHNARSKLKANRSGRVVLYKLWLHIEVSELERLRETHLLGMSSNYGMRKKKARP